MCCTDPSREINSPLILLNFQTPRTYSLLIHSAALFDTEHALCSQYKIYGPHGNDLSRLFDWL